MARRIPSPRTDAFERLRLTKRFLAVRRRGRWVRGALLSVGALPNELPATRLGLRIQRGIRGAVARNRTKRAFRAACRLHTHQLSPGYDVVVVLHRVHDASVAQCEDAWLSAARTLGILTPKQIS